MAIYDLYFRLKELHFSYFSFMTKAENNEMCNVKRFKHKIIRSIWKNSLTNKVWTGALRSGFDARQKVGNPETNKI